MKKIIFVAVLLILLSPWLVFGNVGKNQIDQTELQIEEENQDSDITGRIDEEAAMTVREEIKVSKEKMRDENFSESRNLKKEIYSEQFWVFIFGTYVFLLVFNLSFNFQKSQKVQWSWEAFYTFLAIFVWDQLDFPRTNRWFPGVVMEAGIIIYAAYFYFLNNKIKTEKLSVDK